MTRWERDIVLRTTATHAPAPSSGATGAASPPRSSRRTHGGSCRATPRSSRSSTSSREPARQPDRAALNPSPRIAGRGLRRGRLRLRDGRTQPRLRQPDRPSRGSSACYVDVDAFAAVHRDATLRDPRRLPGGAARGARSRARRFGAMGLENRLEHALAIQEFALGPASTSTRATARRATSTRPRAPRRRRGRSGSRSSSRRRRSSPARWTSRPSSRGSTSRTRSGGWTARTSAVSWTDSPWSSDP